MSKLARQVGIEGPGGPEDEDEGLGDFDRRAALARAAAALQVFLLMVMDQVKLRNEILSFLHKFGLADPQPLVTGPRQRYTSTSRLICTTSNGVEGMTFLKFSLFVRLAHLGRATHVVQPLGVQADCLRPYRCRDTNTAKTRAQGFTKSCKVYTAVGTVVSPRERPFDWMLGCWQARGCYRQCLRHRMTGHCTDTMVSMVKTFRFRYAIS